MLMAHPAVLRSLIEQYETLMLLEAESGARDARQRILRFSRWGRRVDGQSCGGETAVDETGPELDPA
ncbi:DUF5133 domain-containing protein [Streptomyces sp. NBC_01744]|uniref:DUF5133 domain-containing protein n=1 Tax=Streptomyces sp. NBC_01744 TaxID=2975927 RepID=UPI003D9A44B9